MIKDIGNNIARFERVERKDNATVWSVKNQVESYNEFLEEGLARTLDRIAEYLSDQLHRDITIEHQILEPTIYSRSNSSILSNSMSRRVQVRFTKDKVGKKSEWIDFMNIPYMDESGVLNIEGKQRVLLGEIISQEAVSVSNKVIQDKRTTTVVVSMEGYQLSLDVTDKSVRIKMGKHRAADKVIQALMYKTKDLMFGNELIDDVFDNHIFKIQQTDPRLTIPENVHLEMSRYNVDNLLTRKVPKTLRKNLDSLLNFDSAVDHILADDVCTMQGEVLFKKGTYLTRQIVSTLNKSNIFKIAVRAIPQITDYYLSKQVVIKTIPKDVPVTDYLRSQIQDKTKLGNSRQTRHVIEDANITMRTNTKLTLDMVELLYHCGVEEVYIKRGATTSSRPIRIPFKIEFLSNMPDTQFLFRKYGKISKHDEDYINPNDILAGSHLTTYDIAALISYAIRVHLGYEKITYNRDRDFIKKIKLHNELMSESMMQAIQKFFFKYRTPVNNFFADLVDKEVSSVFRGFNKMWLDEMTREKPLIRLKDDTNPLALFSQLNQTIYHSNNSKSVPSILRTLALPFYGRLCPYETPQSKKIGLVNTLAIGCKVEDSIPKTQYYKIRKESNGKMYLSDEVEYLSAEEEQDIHTNLRIGDVLSLEFNEDGSIKDTLTLARIPAPIESDERMSAAQVHAHTLTHVNVLPEQHLSPTATFIPFAGADDGARITFGMSLMKQALPVLNGEAPYVTTSMYREIFDYIKGYCIRAEQGGYVRGITRESVTVEYDDGTTDEILFRERTLTDTSIVFLRCRVYIDERFEAGQVIMDSQVAQNGFFSPGVNCLVAYICDEGWNYEDAIPVSKAVNHRFTAVSINMQKHTVRKAIPIPVNKKRYLRKGDNVFSVERRDNINSTAMKSKTDPIKSETSGVYAEHTQEPSFNYDERIVKSYVLDLKSLKAGDKMAGRHGNKGVKSKAKPVSSMPVFKNGVPVEIMLNPSGVVSRMNIGQVDEAILGFAGYLLNMTMESDSFNGANLDELRIMIRFLHDVANCGGDFDSVVKEWQSVIPPFIINRAEERLDFIMEWEGCFDRNCRAKLYNPETGEFFENTVAFGYAYMIKTVQEADEKIHARSGPLARENYSMIDKQPTKGASNGGGQRVGEMEAAAIVAHGATAVFEEMFQVKSDNTPAQLNLANEMLGGTQPIYEEHELIPRGIDILRYMGESIQFNIDIDRSIYPGNTSSEIKKRKAYSMSDLAKERVNRNTSEFKEAKKSLSSGIMSLREIDEDDDD